MGLSVLLVAAGITHARYRRVPFVASAGAVAVLASLVGRSVEQRGDRFGPGATGALQSAPGNLPELFIALFALRVGLVTVVQSALISSILGNLLLVILSQVFGVATLTLVFPPMLVATVTIAVRMAVFITFDGESTWTESAAMLVLYGVIAASFWWG